MGFNRSVLLTVGVVLAASLLSNATTLPKPKSTSSVSSQTRQPATLPTNQPNTTLTAAGLAVSDGVLSYCARIDRNSSATYQQWKTTVTQAIPRRKLQAYAIARNIQCLLQQSISA
jgi:hypothetical protein